MATEATATASRTLRLRSELIVGEGTRPTNVWHSRTVVTHHIWGVPKLKAEPAWLSHDQNQNQNRSRVSERTLIRALVRERVLRFFLPV